MARFDTLGTFLADLGGSTETIKDMLMVQSDAGPRLYVISFPSQTLTVFDPNAGMRVIDTVSLTLPSGLNTNLHMQFMNDQLFVLGNSGVGAQTFSVSSSGRLGPAQSIFDGASSPLAIEQLSLGSQPTFITTSANSNVLQSWQGGSAPSLTDSLSLGPTVSGADFTAVTHVSNEGANFAVVAGAQSNSLSVVRIEANGSLELTDHLEAGHDLWLNTPSALTSVTIDGQPHIILAAAGSSSLLVARVTSSGSIEFVDQVNDSLHTRFGSVSVLETFELDGHHFVIAGGGDGGLTLLRLIPEIGFVHQHSLIDDATMSLQNISAIAATLSNGRIEISVASEESQSITTLRINPGTLGDVTVGNAGRNNLSGTDGHDVLVGGAGNDTLDGRDGEDILVDGTGVDQLRGGAGADVFVFTADQQSDRIVDFERGIDRIDLSQLGNIYSKAALDFERTSDGVIIRWQDETLEVLSSDGASLRARDFNDSDLFDLDHVQNSLTQAPIQGLNRIYGTQSGDTLNGADGQDLLHGEGPDLLGFDNILSQVFRLYRATLDRDPDEGGHLSWAATLRSGNANLESVTSGFVNSREFQSTYGAADNQEFVTLLYNNVLDRTPDNSGLSHWVTQLESGAMNREQVVLGFSESREHKMTTEIDALSYNWANYCASWTDNVFRLYQATLDRAPDEDGLEYWSNRLAMGTGFTDVVWGFVNSREFQNTYGNTSNQDFVTLLYENVLARSPDAAGLSDWTGQLESGALTRAEVVRGFSESREFIQRTTDPLTAYIRSLDEDDRLSGRDGDNTFFGGRLSDTFVFSARSDSTNVVKDLEPWDHIELQFFDFENTAEVISALSQDGQNVVLQGGTTTIMFEGVATVDFDPDMFILV